jgi:RNA polymerase sigma-70 factor (ECF subfamily)
VTSAEAVYRELAPAVLGYLRASGTPDPEDCLGEVFLGVARDLPRFKGADDAEAVRRWVFTIARHRVVDAARRSRRRPKVVDAPLPDVHGRAEEAEGLDGELLASLRALTPDQREVVALRFVADLSLEDVARLTKRSTGAVKALQHRALENLRAAVSPEPPATL